MKKKLLLHFQTLKKTIVISTFSNN